jgi:predicted permease
VALSLVLLAGAGVLARSALKLRAVDPGFDPSSTFTFWTFLPASSYKRSTDVARFYETAIDRIESLNGVTAASATSKLPLEIEGTPYEVFVWADGSPIATNALPPVFHMTSTTTGYFTSMKIPLVAGRSFDDANVRRSAYESVVSRGVVEEIWHDATGLSGVGKRIRLAPDAPWYTIVGVVGDVRDSTLTEPAISEVYFPQAASEDSAFQSQTKREMAFVVRARGPVAAVQHQVEDELHALDRNLPFYRPSTMHEIVSGANRRMTLALMLLASGASATLLLAIIGLYGVIAYGVSLRSREISIRIALGLPPSGALMMILKQGGMIIAIGATAGALTFLMFARLLNTLAFGVSTLDPFTVAMAMGAVLVVAGAATWLPARRAARFDPALALRGE